jgi:SAM-dependent methyltransferase
MQFQRSDYPKIANKIIPCACCGSSSFTATCYNDRYNFGIRTVVCNNCGLIFTSPRPENAWFKDFYRYHYRRYYEDVAIPDEAYLNKDWVQGRHQRNVELLSSYLPKSGRLLDVGCAEGTFLHLFTQKFPQWEAQGIEPSEDFSSFARSYYRLASIDTGEIEDLCNYPPYSYNLITASHVLEHLLDPNFLFIIARRLLKDQGLLFVDIPDAESKDCGIGHLHIAHVYHFSEKSLTNFFHKHGFEIIMSQRGNEKPIPWTLQVIGNKNHVVPIDWKPISVNSKQIARAFAIRCRTPAHVRLRKIFRKFVKGF